VARGNGLEPRHDALVVRLSAIGDIVHTLPVAAALHRSGWRVTWLVAPAGRPLVAENPVVAEVIAAPRRGALRRTVAALRARRFDVAFDVQGLWKSALWTRLARADRRVGMARRLRREPASAVLLGETLAPEFAAPHVVDQNLSLLRAAGIPVGSSSPPREFPLPSLEQAGRRVAAERAALGVALADDYVLLHPGGGWESKLWPVERWAALARDLRARGVAPLVSWGPGESTLARAVVDRSGGAAVECFPTSLLELAALARDAVMVAADTGPLHLAAAAGARVVGLYGPTDPARNGPYAPGAVILRRVPPCAPCHRRSCPRHAGIVGEIPAEEVLAAVEGQRALRAG
jgi:ADP-heptose:LPS heptosyltransferase